MESLGITEESAGCPIRATMEVKELLHTKVEEMKNKKRMRVNEMIDSPFDADGDGDIDFDDNTF